MREVAIEPAMATDEASFAACIATILELPFEDVPIVPAGEPVDGRRVARWLGQFNVGLVAVANPPAFTWPGPWIARIRNAEQRRAVVMFGVPSGVVWDPAGITKTEGWTIESGYVIAAADIALARPPRLTIPVTKGTVDSIWIAEAAGAPARPLDEARAIVGFGLEGDRYVVGTGTFPNQLPGSALTLIEAEVCESFTPPLPPSVHRRNIVTRGIALDRLVGHEFSIGALRCRGVRLCEPCLVIQRHSDRPILRELVHRGGLRADILEGGIVRIGDAVSAIG